MLDLNYKVNVANEKNHKRTGSKMSMGSLASKVAAKLE